MEERFTGWHRANFDALLNFDRQFGEHGLKAMAGWHTEKYDYTYNQQFRKNFPTNDLTDIAAGDAATQKNNGYTRELAMISWFGRINYDYAGKYLLEGNIRSDASSRFADGNRWGYFPSFSAAWRISEEGFMENTKDWLNNLKIRGSWGLLGNQDALTDYYPWMNTYNLDASYPLGGALQSGYYQKAYKLSSISWEKSRTWGLGFDATVNNKINVTFDYYDRRTTGIIMDVPVPAEFGLDAYKDNVGEMSNRGVEVILSYNNKWGDWSFGATGNFSYNKNELLDLGLSPDAGGVTADPNNGNKVRKIGEALNTYRVYKADGFFESDEAAQAWMDKYSTQAGYPFGTKKFKGGDLIYQDANGDGKMTADDRVLAGSSDPKFTFGLNLNAAYKGFDLSMLFTGAAGVHRLINQEVTGYFGGGVGLFTGRVPFVWLCNAYNNTGMELKGTTINQVEDAEGNITQYAPSLGEYADNPLGALQSMSGSAAKPDIVTVDKDFKYPQVFRTNLALEQMLPGDVKFTLEGIYSKTLNNVFFENLALSNNGEKVYAIPGVEASAAPFYSNAKRDYYSVINLKNTNKGYTYAISGLLEKHFNFGLDMSASYTFGHAKAVNDGTSSVAYSNWKYNYSRDTNSEDELGFSKFDIPHRLMIQLSYTTPKYLNGWMATTVALIYNAFSGSRYSLTMNESSDFNGDGYRGNSLLYIPTESELQQMNFVDYVDKKTGAVIMSAEESRQAFGNWIENDSYAKNHRGQYAERNSNLSDWEHQIDLHIAQDIFYLKERGSKIQVTFDVVNFTNMLNKKWGASYSSAYNVSPLSVQSIATEADGSRTPAYTYNSNNEVAKDDIASRWHAQVGVRLTF